MDEVSFITEAITGQMIKKIIKLLINFLNFLSSIVVFSSFLFCTFFILYNFIL